ncbi:Superfamily I DNA and RNA helicases [Mycobacteroides abscessus subsp. abscessus]|uniref:DEAD/DEAH box helicase n=1 Tax=Mycobacteroides abscessus TaxID=36809 RepID=UPI00092ABB8C|nr:ATP-binding domain-containing protein [Mycobacteroides abscessus]SID09537.1 Superfamily I DNA and RNA helicases [Mycobacteroides abscessus subsp. abscessus]SKU77128.1 Superfamily I DNA and RNA helicases [Mycobacteroides abscessus subsp. abscessus]
MGLEVIRGASRNRGAAGALATSLAAVVDEGTIYLGYPVLATADEKVEVDALLVSRRHGLVAFLICDSVPSSSDEENAAIVEQDRLFAVIESYLGRHEGLRERRTLAIRPNTASIFAAPPTPNLLEASGDGSFYGELSELSSWLDTCPPISAQLEKNLQAALQRVTTIKPAKRRAAVSNPTSRGAKLKTIEKGIANLDRWQKQAAIETPEGPQRIRGLAGSGKTVVLALKAAYWHTTNPNWRIALTFHSRALYQQIDDLVTRFTFEHGNDRPDPEQLRIMHSWGSRARAGVYSMIASALGETPRDWAYAQGKYGMDNAFEGICRELLAVAKSRQVESIFDAVLIDEAQDLPPEFFQLVYMFTAEPKRIVWGYDELQRLSEAAMPSTSELFGTGAGGAQLVSLEAAADEPRRDIVLPVCYRNTPWALATAHAIGIGVYRQDGLLQHPDQPELWRDIGYSVVHGQLTEGQPVALQRSASSYPSYFPDLLRDDDAVVVKSFPDEHSHDVWIAEQIEKNLSEDELEHDDILIVLPDSYRAKSRAPRLMRELNRRNIPAHLVGVNTSADEVVRLGSVAIAHIYRAKGNEAPMVYAVDAHYAAQDFNAVTRRNKLFTAITRSRAWVRITGWGDGMETIKGEADNVSSRGYKLEFTVPTAPQLAQMRHIHRDRPDGAEETVRRATEGISTFLEAVERGEMDLYDLPADLRTRLTMLRRNDNEVGDGSDS